MQVVVGMLLYGYCEGYFGRVFTSLRRVEAFGPDWLVARQLRSDAEPEFATFTSPTDMQECITRWSQPEAA